MNKLVSVSGSFFATIAITILLALSPVVLAQAQTSWTTQTVDINGFAWSNGYCSIVLDSKNNPHIAYTGVHLVPDSMGVIRFPISLVMYASWNSTSFNTQQIAIGTAFSLKLDSNGSPHVLFCSGSTANAFGPLMYATWTGYSWDIQTVDRSFWNGYGALALDSKGSPHVAYTDGQLIKYATREGSVWSIQTVGNFSEVKFKLSLGLDKENNPNIYFDHTISIETNESIAARAQNSNIGATYYHLEELNLASLKEAKWSTQNISFSRDIGNIAMDSKGLPHLTYLVSNPNVGSSNNKTLIYASWNGSTWNTQPVLSESNLYMGSLALDSKDNPHITYKVDNQPMYVKWMETYWGTQKAGLSGSLAIDSRGNPHVSSFVNPPAGVNMRIAYVNYSTMDETKQTFTPLPSLSITTKDSPFSLLVILLVAAILVPISALTAFLIRKSRKQLKN